MANVHGKNVLFTFEDANGVAVDITGGGNQVALVETTPSTEDTGFGDTSVQRIPKTIPDAKVQYEAYANDSVTTGNIRLLGDLKGRPTVINFVGAHIYSASMLISEVEIRNPNDNLVVCRAAFELSSGSISRANKVLQYLTAENGYFLIAESGSALVSEATNDPLLIDRLF